MSFVNREGNILTGMISPESNMICIDEAADDSFEDVSLSYFSTDFQLSLEVKEREESFDSEWEMCSEVSSVQSFGTDSNIELKEDVRSYREVLMKVIHKPHPTVVRQPSTFPVRHSRSKEKICHTRNFCYDCFDDKDECYCARFDAVFGDSSYFRDIVKETRGGKSKLMFKGNVKSQKSRRVSWDKCGHIEFKRKEFASMKENCRRLEFI